MYAVQQPYQAYTIRNTEKNEEVREGKEKCKDKSLKNALNRDR